MVLSLTVADLIVSYIVIPLEIGWRISVQVRFLDNKWCSYWSLSLNPVFVVVVCPILQYFGQIM